MTKEFLLRLDQETGCTESSAGGGNTGVLRVAPCACRMERASEPRMTAAVTFHERGNVALSRQAARNSKSEALPANLLLQKRRLRECCLDSMKADGLW